MDKQIKTVEELDRNELIKGNKKDTPVSTRIPLTTRYNQFLPTWVKLFEKIGIYYQWANPWKKNLQNKPVKTFKHNKNLKELIGSNKIENNIVKKINKSTLKPGKCSPCFGNSRTLSCNQVTTTSTFKSQETQKTYKIFYEVALYVKNPHPKTILACKHFREKNNNFNKHVKFIITE